MYVEHVNINDLRCFAGVHAVDLPGPGAWVVLAGRNGAGKTTLLRAIAAALVGPQLARELLGRGLRWVRWFVAGQCGVSLRVRSVTGIDTVAGVEQGEPVDWWLPTLAFSLRTDGAGDLIISPATQAAEGDVRWSDLVKNASAPEFPPLVQRAFDLLDAGPWGPHTSGWFVAAYGAHRRLGPPSKDVQDRSADPVYARVVNLFSEGATLSDAVDWLKQVHLRALEEREGAKALREGALSFLRQGLLPDGSEVLRIDSDGLWVRRDGVELPLEHLSDGYRTVTALVLDLLRHLHRCYGDLRLQTDADGHQVCPLPGVVLIDEVDAHLHVEWQQRIGFWLRQHFPALQFIVTTHSPFICQAASPGGLIRLPGPGGAEQIAPVSDELHRTVTLGGVDAAVLTALFGLDSPRSARAEELREEVAALELRVLRGLATPEERALYAARKADLPDDLGDLAEQSLRAVGRARAGA